MQCSWVIEYADSPIQALRQWRAFTEAVRQELIPMNSFCSSRDQLMSLRQNSIVSSYIIELKNTATGILGKWKDEKLNKFCSRLKVMVHLEVSVPVP